MPVVAVTVVKLPVVAVVAPIVVPLIVPPVTVMPDDANVLSVAVDDADRVVNAPVLAVVAPTVVLLTEPPVIATALAACVDIVPNPVTEVFAITIGVFVTLDTCPCALVTNTGTLDAEP